MRQGVADRLATALGVSTARVTIPHQIGEHQLHFRRKSALGLREADRIKSMAREQAENWLERNRFDSARLDKVMAPGQPEVAARRLRDALGIPASDPVESVFDAFRWLGVPVFPLRDVPPAFDGHAARTDRVAFVAVNYSDAIPGDRLRWTMAHELAHLLLGHADYERQLDDDGTRDALEAGANACGMEFLFPRSARRRELHTLMRKKRTDWRVLIHLKERWLVSLQAMIVTSGPAPKGDGVIDDERKDAMFRYLSWKGWRRQEPGDVPREDLHLLT